MLAERNIAKLQTTPHLESIRPHDTSMSTDKKDLSFVVEQLSFEFHEQIDGTTIRLVAMQEMGHLEKAKVREFISLIAVRLARRRLLELVDEMKRFAPEAT